MLALHFITCNYPHLHPTSGRAQAKEFCLLCDPLGQNTMPIQLPRDYALTVLRRLEAATSRLEDMVPNISDSTTSPNGIQLGSGESLSAAEARSQAIANGTSSQRHLETLPPVIDDFDGTINGEVKTFVNMSEEIGGLVAEQVHPSSCRLSSRSTLIEADFTNLSLPLFYAPLQLSENSLLSQPRLESQRSSHQSTWRY